ncbi:MAG: hypothetical protein HY909_04585 [Deltaproteobacteria bacterium]|nr:hypothetical protein [Deltaproteobacteria bacterium]
MRRIVLLVVVLGGCATAQPSPPDVVAGYASALREGRLIDAWRTLSAEAREALPYEDFARTVREHPEEARDAVEALSRVDPRGEVTATLDLDSGETLTLTLEGGQWRLDPSALEFYGQGTPRQALRSFVRALERQRWDVLLRLAPRSVAEALASPPEGATGPVPSAAERLREAWSGREADAVQHTLTRLLEALNNRRPIEVVGDRATMVYGPGGQAQALLVREDGRWKVERTE